MSLRGLFVITALSGLSCAGAAPAPLGTGHEPCRSCQMIVSDVHTAAQIVAPGEDPLFFDDIGCLRTYLAGPRRIAAEARIYVADHRTGTWVDARQAVFSEVDGLSTPMLSRLAAYASDTSRDADLRGRAHRPVPASFVLVGR